jgi:hypothetical protein
MIGPAPRLNRGIPGVLPTWEDARKEHPRVSRIVALAGIGSILDRWSRTRRGGLRSRYARVDRTAELQEGLGAIYGHRPSTQLLWAFAWETAEIVTASPFDSKVRAVAWAKIHVRRGNYEVDAQSGEATVTRPATVNMGRCPACIGGMVDSTCRECEGWGEGTVIRTCQACWGTGDTVDLSWLVKHAAPDWDPDEDGPRLPGVIEAMLVEADRRQGLGDELGEWIALWLADDDAWAVDAMDMFENDFMSGFE